MHACATPASAPDANGPEAPSSSSSSFPAIDPLIVDVAGQIDDSIPKFFELGERRDSKTGGWNHLTVPTYVLVAQIFTVAPEDAPRRSEHSVDDYDS